MVLLLPNVPLGNIYINEVKHANTSSPCQGLDLIIQNWRKMDSPHQLRFLFKITHISVSLFSRNFPLLSFISPCGSAVYCS